MQQEPENHGAREWPSSPSDEGPGCSIYGVEIPFPFSLLVSLLAIPLLVIGAVLSFPVMKVQSRLERRREQRVLEQLRAVGRYRSWAEAIGDVRAGDGMFILEFLSVKGPCRLWWTPEDVPVLAPFPCCYAELPWEASFEEEGTKDFFLWCRSRLTDLQTGTALLVDREGVDPAESRSSLDAARAEQRIITIGHLPDHRVQTSAAT